MLIACAVAWVCAAGVAHAQAPRPEFRAVWIDTFNTRLASSDDVATAVARAEALHANVLFVQVRRRGDARYLDSEEPPGEGVGAGFDPLGEVLSQARARGLQVHAFVTLGAVWNLTTPPISPQHVFNRHGLGSGRAPDGRANWLTRTLVGDGAGTSHDGYRFGNDFWLDPGHPDVADYLVDLAVRLVTRYPVDGVHLDRVQYPEVPGASGSQVLSVGYNPTAVARYNARYGTAGLPAADDARFSAWRREQVTSLVRRLTTSLLAVRPSLVVSVAASASGPPPTLLGGGFSESVPYGLLFQDWQAWLSTGMVDLVVPHLFLPEHVAGEAETAAGWMAWARAGQQRRGVVMGLGAYLNSVEGTVRQVWTALEPGSAGQPPFAGVALFSLAANNAPVVSNPLSVPPGRDTPQRAVEDLAAGLRFGRTTTGLPVDPASAGPFAEPAAVPALPWKTREGHVLGELRDEAGRPLDGVEVQAVASGVGVGVVDEAAATAVSDGSGVFALVALAPGRYRLSARRDGALWPGACEVEVQAAEVSRIVLTVGPAGPGSDLRCAVPGSDLRSGGLGVRPAGR